MMPGVLRFRTGEQGLKTEDGRGMGEEKEKDGGQMFFNWEFGPIECCMVGFDLDAYDTRGH